MVNEPVSLVVLARQIKWLVGVFTFAYVVAIVLFVATFSGEFALRKRLTVISDLHSEGPIDAEDDLDTTGAMGEDDLPGAQPRGDLGASAILVVRVLLQLSRLECVEKAFDLELEGRRHPRHNGFHALKELENGTAVDLRRQVPVLRPVVPGLAHKLQPQVCLRLKEAHNDRYRPAANYILLCLRLLSVLLYWDVLLLHRLQF